MMGFADFPVEILKALRVKPSENNVDSEGSCHCLKLLPEPVIIMLIERPSSYSPISWRESKICQFLQSITRLSADRHRESRRLD